MSFTYLFYKHIMFRKSCGKCHFCNIKRPSDITLADFWGWEKIDSTLNKDDKGISLVVINTTKGREIWESVNNQMNTREVDINNCLQPNLIHPSQMHPNKKLFEIIYKYLGFRAISILYLRYGKIGRLLNILNFHKYWKIIKIVNK